MKKKIFPAIGVGVGILIIAIVSFSLSSNGKTSSEQFDEETSFVPSDAGFGISYTAVNYELKQILEENAISMSSPIKLDDLRAIWTYCNFFQGEEQKLVEHCTSTELLDTDGNFLGNIHAFGTPDDPKRIMAVIQVDPFLNQKEDAKTVFSVLTNKIVCDCWTVKNDKGISMNDWAEAYITSHISAGKPTTMSNTIFLEDRSIQMKLITNTEGYEWQFLVTA